MVTFMDAVLWPGAPMLTVRSPGSTGILESRAADSSVTSSIFT
jgi:hypothetical protein